MRPAELNLLRTFLEFALSPHLVRGVQLPHQLMLAQLCPQAFDVRPGGPRFLDLPPHGLGEADKRQIASVAHDGDDKAVMRKVDGDAY